MSTIRYLQWAQSNLDIKLTGSNGQMYASCPFKENHSNGDRTPSFGIDVRRGLYLCYACGVKGNFAQLAERLNVRLIEVPPTAEELHSRVQQLRDSIILEEVQTRMPETWLDQFTISSRKESYWIDERGIAAEVIDAFKLGYDRATTSATIPLRDFRGNLLGVIRRRLAPKARPRYLYPKGFKITLHLWGAYACKGQPSIAVCEGSIDALAMWSVGIPAVALLGSSISTHQANILLKLGCNSIVVMTDRDTEGRKAAAKIREKTSGVIVKMGTYKAAWVVRDPVTHRPRGAKDPAELSPRQRTAMFNAATIIPKVQTRRSQASMSHSAKNRLHTAR